MTTLRELIEPHKRRITALWLDKSLEVYPVDSRKFFGERKDRFANPVGTALKRGIESFVEGLLRDEPPAALAAHLEEIVQIRSVQQLEPSKALGFVMVLKDIVREVLSGERPGAEAAIDRTAAAIDAACLETFDLYVKYRERLFDVRVSDVKRQVSHLLKRTSFFNIDDEEPETGSKSVTPEPGDDRPPGR